MQSVYLAHRNATLDGYTLSSKKLRMNECISCMATLGVGCSGANKMFIFRTFMTLRDPGIFFRALILGAQGVFYNLFFVWLCRWAMKTVV
jgi:hypothetical protein